MWPNEESMVHRRGWQHVGAKREVSRARCLWWKKDVHFCPSKESMVQDEDATILRLSGRIFAMHLDDFAVFLYVFWMGFWVVDEGSIHGPWCIHGPWSMAHPWCMVDPWPMVHLQSMVQDEDATMLRLNGRFFVARFWLQCIWMILLCF